QTDETVQMVQTLQTVQTAADPAPMRSVRGIGSSASIGRRTPASRGAGKGGGPIVERSFWTSTRKRWYAAMNSTGDASATRCAKADSRVRKSSAPRMSFVDAVG